MEEGDAWFAEDKLHHLLACFLITLLVAAVSSRSRYPFLRRWSVALGSLAALTAGAAKEAGDEIGLWNSAGGSAKDASADLLGVLLAALSLSLWKRLFSSAPREWDRDRGVSMV